LPQEWIKGLGLRTNQADRIEEAWCRGVLSWKFHAGQDKIEEAFNNSQGKLFVGNCARRFGKTYWAATKSVEKAIQVENAQVWYVSAFLNDLQKFIIPIFKEVLKDCPEPLAPVWKSVVKEIEFENGSKIHLVGLDRNPDGIRGNYADLVVFEEARNISRLGYLYSSVVLPMTMYRDGARVVMISTPPETPAHEFQEFCEKAKLAGSYAKLDIYENPMVTQPMIDELKQELDIDAFKRECLCEFVVDQNKAIIREWDERFEVSPERPRHFEFMDRYVSMDIGVKDLTAVLFAYWDCLSKRLVVEKEVDMFGPDMTTDRLALLIRSTEQRLWRVPCGCQECLNKTPLPPPPPVSERFGGQATPLPLERAQESIHGLLPVYRRIADNNNLLLLQDLGSLHGLHFVPTGKDNLDAMINETRYFISQGKLLVDPLCKKLLGCIKYGIWDKNRTSFGRSKAYGHFDHLAALIYLIRNIDQESNKIPTHLNITPQTHYISDFFEKQLSPTAQVFKKIFRL